MAQDKQQGSMSVNEAGKKGGDATSASHDKEFYQEIGSKGGQNSGGNFKNDPERASEAGSKGGQNSGGNFANDRNRASEAGSKGGQSSGATLPTIGKKPLKLDTKVVKTAMVAGATVDASGAGERGSPAHFHSSEITAIA